MHLPLGTRVRIYWNAHRNTFSVQSKLPEGWRVKWHLDNDDLLAVVDAKFHVSEAGRQRVLAKRSKNVHAWIEGAVDRGSHMGIGGDPSYVTYNPYKEDSFVAFKDDPITSERHPIYEAPVVWAIMHGAKPRVVVDRYNNDNGS